MSIRMSTIANPKIRSTERVNIFGVISPTYHDAERLMHKLPVPEGVAWHWFPTKSAVQRWAKRCWDRHVPVNILTYDLRIWGNDDAD